MNINIAVSFIMAMGYEIFAIDNLNFDDYDPVKEHMNC